MLCYAKVRDALRYTTILPPERCDQREPNPPSVRAACNPGDDEFASRCRYCAGVARMRSALLAAGLEGEKLKNYWVGGDNYLGVNDVFFATAGETRCKFELQARPHPPT
jgi:hypothetical protein